MSKMVIMVMMIIMSKMAIISELVMTMVMIIIMSKMAIMSELVMTMVVIMIRRRRKVKQPKQEEEVHLVIMANISCGAFRKRYRWQ